MTGKGFELEAVDYTKQPLTAEALKKLLRSAGLKPMDAMRTREAAYQQLVAGKNRSDDELLALMVKHPELIQRPLVVRGKKVVLARPVQRLKALGI
ncbi:MAG: arsenate reductase (glutaredoxin) [Acidobacteriia bacterium]|nr:arsenate reductase (glutaredoxin) [Terriglobia bacterium]